MPGKFKFLTFCMSKPHRDTGRSRSTSPQFFRPPDSPIRLKKTSSQQQCTKIANSAGPISVASSACGTTADLPSATAKVRQPLNSSFITDKMAAPTRIMLLACGSFNPITNMHLRMFEIARDYLHHTGKYQVVGGILSPVNDGYGKKGLLPSKQRIEMCKLATEGSDWLKIDTWEADQSSWTETAMVVKHFADELTSNKINNNPDLPLPPPRMSTISRRGTKRRRNTRKNEPAVSNDIEPEDAYGTPLLRGHVVPPETQIKLLCGADLLESFAVPGLWKTEDLEMIVGRYGLVVITRNGSDPYKFVYESDLLFKYSNNIQIVTEWINNEISSTKIRTALRRNQSVKYLIPDPVVKYIQAHRLYKEAQSPVEKSDTTS